MLYDLIYKEGVLKFQCIKKVSWKRIPAVFKKSNMHKQSFKTSFSLNEKKRRKKKLNALSF